MIKVIKPEWEVVKSCKDGNFHVAIRTSVDEEEDEMPAVVHDDAVREEEEEKPNVLDLQGCAVSIFSRFTPDTSVNPKAIVYKTPKDINNDYYIPADAQNRGYYMTDALLESLRSATERLTGNENFTEQGEEVVVARENGEYTYYATQSRKCLGIIKALEDGFRDPRLFLPTVPKTPFGELFCQLGAGTILGVTLPVSP